VQNNFLIAVGIMLVSPGLTAIVTREYHGGWRETSVTMIGLFVLFLGLLWADASKAFPQAFVDRINQDSSKPRAWFVLLMVLWTYSVAVQLWERVHLKEITDVQSQLGSIQTTVDYFVTPRHLTSEQAKTIADHLLDRPAQTVTVRSCNHDSEAHNYASQIYDSLRAGGWEVDRQVMTAAEFAKHSNISEGLGIFGEMDATKNFPRAGQFLKEAFDLAQVSVPSSGGPGGAGSIVVQVGHRKRTRNGEEGP
jgi:hypothetical protein